MKIYTLTTEKNEQLINERDISFEKVVFNIENGGLLDDIAHPNCQDHAHRRIFVVVMESYVYLFPYVETEAEIFLKAIIPSKKFTKVYLEDDV